MKADAKSEEESSLLPNTLFAPQDRQVFDLDQSMNRSQDM